ncbi:MAG: hypothetical protein LBM96_07135 [Methanobrevibacter sp.]|jgi:hypothetical protein|nr:hypothetical protein [Candidatus Methanoflexus mossambicus]
MTFEELFGKEKLDEMEKLFEDETKFFQEHPEEELKYIYNKGFYDTLSLADPKGYGKTLSKTMQVMFL